MKPHHIHRVSLPMRVAIAVVVAFGVAAIGPASAAKKRPGVPGVSCTLAQINTPGGAACVAKQQKDIQNGVQNIHHVICLKDGSTYCCQESGTGSRSCDSISIVGGIGTTNQPPIGGELQP